VGSPGQSPDHLERSAGDVDGRDPRLEIGADFISDAYRPLIGNVFGTEEMTGRLSFQVGLVALDATSISGGNDSSCGSSSSHIRCRCSGPNLSRLTTEVRTTLLISFRTWHHRLVFISC